MRFTQKTLAILLALLLVSGGPAFPQQASSAVSEAVSSVGGTVQPSAGGVSRIDTKAPLTREDLNPYQIAVPQELGSIEEVFQGSSNSPLIVYIQNVHANYEAQKNIKGILNQLVDQYQFSLVQMEGAVSKLNPEILKPSYLEEANLQLVDFLMREGRITGADAFAAETDKPVAFYGVEDRGLYMENLKTFKSVYRHQEEVNAFFGEIHRLILDIGPKLLNPELLDFTRKTEAFGTDRIDLMDYLVYLNELSERHSLVSLKDMKEIFEYPNLVRLMRLHVLEEKLNQSGLKKETEALKQEFQKRMPGSEKMEELTAKLDESVKGTNPRSYFIELTKLADEAKIDFINYPAFRIFAEFLIHQDEIDHRALFSELKRFEKSLQDELFTKEDEQKFLEIIDYTGLLEQYFRLEMSREKLVLYLNHRDEMKPSWISNELSALAVKYAVQAKPVSNTETLDAYMDELEYFYQLVLKRDEIFTQRILEQMKSLKQDKTVVITGGFHKDGLVDYFRKENISYVIVNPKVDIAQGSENYLKVMLEGDAVVGSVFAGTFAIEVKVLTDTTALANQDRAFLGNAYVAAGVNTARRAGVTANVQAALNKRAEVIGSQAGVFVEFTQPFRPAGQLVLASGTRITRQHVQPSGAVLAQGISVREQIDEGGNFEVVPEAEFKPTTREEQLAGIRPELVGRAPTQSAAADIPDRSEFPRLAASLIRPPTDITEPVTPPVTPTRATVQQLFPLGTLVFLEPVVSLYPPLFKLAFNPAVETFLRLYSLEEGTPSPQRVAELVDQSLEASSVLIPEVTGAKVEKVVQGEEASQVRFFAQTEQASPRILVELLDKRDQEGRAQIRGIVEELQRNPWAVAVIYGANAQALTGKILENVPTGIAGRVEAVDTQEPMAAIEEDFIAGKPFNFYLRVGNPPAVRLSVQEMRADGVARFRGPVGSDFSAVQQELLTRNIVVYEIKALALDPEAVRNDPKLPEAVRGFEHRFMSVLPLKHELDQLDATLLQYAIPNVITRSGRDFQWQLAAGALGLIRSIYAAYLNVIYVERAA